MKKDWPFSQVLLLSSITVAIVAVIITIIITNTTLRSVEKNLPNTLINELVSLDLVLEQIAEVVSAAQIVAENTSPQNFDRMKKKVQTTFESIETLRQTYVFDNLVQASAFHAVVAPAIADLQIWLYEGISGYGPQSKTTAQIALSRISASFQKAKALNHQSRLNARNKLDEERARLDRFLSNVNQLFMLTLLITFIMIFLFVRQHFLKIREKEAEKALQESEKKYRAIVENTPDLLYRTDMNGLIIFISSSVYRLSGYTVKEALGMKMAEEVYAFPEERQIFLEKLKTNGFIKNFEARLKRKDGSIWWASTNAHFAKDADGSIQGIEGITRDITDTKQAEAALKESEQRMRAILEAAPDPMVLYNTIGHPQYISPSFTEVFGWTLDDLRGRLIPFVPEDQKLLTAEKIKEIYALGKPLKFETQRKTKDNRSLDIILSAAVTKGIDGAPTGLVVNLTDITRRKALEAQYEQAQKMESLGTLAGGIAHDFNNLLGGIFGYLDLARKKTKEPKIAEYLTKAFHTSERAKGLTLQLLTFSKGGTPVKKVEALVPFLQETTHFALSGSNVSCSFHLPDDLWMCDYDKNQIGQVIDNIIINAHHSMPSGGNIHVVATNMTVREKEHPGLSPDKYVKISISDAGAGIQEKHISKIFDPFFTTKQKGSGLGLATSYSIVKRHGGIIEVESEPGVGSTFHVYLPATKKHGAKEKTLTEKLYQGSGHILIMDDEQMIQEVLTDMIETMGFSVTATDEGREAVEAFKKATKLNSPFCAVILDLTVPGGMGGKETVKEIRKTDKTIPVFVVSGYSEEAAIANPEKYGFTASLQKPFMIEQLAQMFEQYL